MSDEQAKAYDEAVDRLVKVTQDDAVEIDAVFTRLRQLASGYLVFTDTAGNQRTIDYPDAAKFEWLDSFLSDLPEWQICIFHEFTHSGSRIVQLLKDHKIPHDWLHGGTKDRPALLERFRNGTTRILCCQTATGGMAIDLSPADHMIVFESTPSVIIRKQMEARPLARGDRPLILDDLICAPIERKLLDFLAQGEGLREVLLRDPRRIAEQVRRR
jgi:SNF2 family DNA or RNA helicase